MIAGAARQIEALHDELKPKLANGEKLESVRDARPEIRTALERAEHFLGLAALTAAILAGAAMALASRRFVLRHLDTCAMLRCLGAQQEQVLRLFLYQFLLIGFIAVLLGCLLGYATHQPDLYVSAGLTLVLKVMLIPWLLHRVIRRLDVRWDVETLINIPTTMLVGIGLVIFSFSLALPISRLSSSMAGGSLGIALACVLLSFMMMITRSKAVPQVIGFLSMENGLIFAATTVTSGMPMIVEFGIALDVLVGVLILGVFMFQIREKFDSLDIHNLEALKED